MSPFLLLRFLLACVLSAVPTELFEFQLTFPFFYLRHLGLVRRVIQALAHCALQSCIRFSFCCHEPRPGFEPGTYSLPWSCSATELPRHQITPTVGGRGLEPLEPEGIWFTAKRNCRYTNRPIEKVYQKYIFFSSPNHPSVFCLPLPYLFMVARNQNFWNFPPPEYFRAGILGILYESSP